MTRDDDTQPQATALPAALPAVKSPPFGVRGVIGNILGYIYGIASIPVVLFIGGLGVPFCRTRAGAAYLQFLTRLWMRIFVILFGVRIVVDGRERFDPRQRYVIASNHRSWLDAMVIVLTLGRALDVVFVIKRSLIYIPIFGVYILALGYIPVRRGGGRAKQAQGQIDAGVRAIQRGRSVLVFPEGTRSTSHQFARFRPGAAAIAVRSGASLLPVILSGSGRLFPKGSPFVRPGTVRIEIMDPMPVAGVDREVLLNELVDVVVGRYRLLPDDPPCSESDPGVFASLQESARPRRAR